MLALTDYSQAVDHRGERESAREDAVDRAYIDLTRDRDAVEAAWTAVLEDEIELANRLCGIDMFRLFHANGMSESDRLARNELQAVLTTMVADVLEARAENEVRA
jgi:hypothetical protein